MQNYLLSQFVYCVGSCVGVVWVSAALLQRAVLKCAVALFPNLTKITVMKYLLSFFIFAVSFASRAQTAAITVTNINPVCTAYVNLYAADIPNGNQPCGIVSNTIMLTPMGGSLIAGSWTTLAGMLNFTAPVPLSTTTFYWSDITFQWYCPSPPCGPTLTWGIMSDPVALPFDCYNNPAVWAGSGCTVSGTWTNIPGTPTMANIRVVLN